MNTITTTLFKIIDTAKWLGCYQIANVAFELLLKLNYDLKLGLRIEVETSNETIVFISPFVLGKGYYIEHTQTYYDLLVLKYEVKQGEHYKSFYACIPMPLLEVGNHLWYALEHAQFTEKRRHNRVTLWDSIARSINTSIKTN